MDKLVRKIEIPLAKKAIEKAGLYIISKKDLERMGDIAADAYLDYPLHTWFAKGKYGAKATEMIINISLKTMSEDAVIYADSEEMNGFAVWLPFGFNGSKTLNCRPTAKWSIRQYKIFLLPILRCGLKAM